MFTLLMKKNSGTLHQGYVYNYTLSRGCVRCSNISQYNHVTDSINIFQVTMDLQFPQGCFQILEILEEERA